MALTRMNMDLEARASARVWTRAAALLVLAVFALSPKLVGDLRAGDIIALVAAAFLVVRHVRARNVALHRDELLFLAFLAWASLTTAYSLANGMNGRGLAAAMTIMRLVEFAVLYAIAAIAAGSMRGKNDTFGGSVRIAAGALVLFFASWALVEAYRSYAVMGYEFDRAFNTGFFEGESNHVAGAAAVLGVLSPWFGIPALVAILLSGSRIALFAFILGFARRVAVERRAYGALLIVVVLAAAFLAQPAWRDRLVGSLRPTADYSGPHVDRFHSWKTIIGETPVIAGSGLGSRPSAVYESLYVMLYAETGVVGLALFVAALASAFLRARSDASAASVLIVFASLSLTMNALIIARVMAPVALLTRLP